MDHWAPGVADDGKVDVIGIVKDENIERQPCGDARGYISTEADAGGPPRRYLAE